jgi:hypothetical protein
MGATGEAIRVENEQPLRDDTLVFSRHLVACLADNAIFVAPTDLIVEKITVRYVTAQGGTSTATFHHFPSESAINATAAVANQLDTGSSIDLNSTVNKNYDATIVAANNRILAGDLVTMRIATANNTVANVTITVVCRKPS